MSTTKATAMQRKRDNRKRKHTSACWNSSMSPMCVHTNKTHVLIDPHSIKVITDYTRRRGGVSGIFYRLTSCVCSDCLEIFCWLKLRNGIRLINEPVLAERAIRRIGRRQRDIRNQWEEYVPQEEKNRNDESCFSSAEKNRQRNRLMGQSIFLIADQFRLQTTYHVFRVKTSSIDR